MLRIRILIRIRV